MTTPSDPNTPGGYPPPQPPEGGAGSSGGYSPAPQEGGYPPGQGGYPPGGYPPGQGAAAGYSGAPTAARNGLGIAALVVGILAIIGIITVYGAVILGIIAIVLGFLGRSRAKRGEATNGGMALSGAILGLIALIIAVILIIAGAAFLNSGKGKCIKNSSSQSQKQNCLNK